MNITLGTAPDSWGVWFQDDPEQIDWERYLDEVRMAGYAWTELGPFGYLPKNPDHLKQELGSRDLRLCGATIGGQLSKRDAVKSIEQELEALMDLLDYFKEARTIVVLPESYTDFHTGSQILPKEAESGQWRQVIDTVHRLGKFAGDRDYSILFHPHADSWFEHEDQIARFLADTDPDRVGLCFDTGHHAYSGGNPIAFFREYHARIPYLHLKSVDSEVLEEAQEKGLSFAQAVALDVMCEPAIGRVDFPAFRDALLEVNYEGFAIVEQDMYPASPDRPFSIAKRTHAYLSGLGFGGRLVMN